MKLRHLIVPVPEANGVKEIPLDGPPINGTMRLRRQEHPADVARAEDSLTEVDTIYFGGGTPSRMGGAGVTRALELVRERFPLAAGAEVTIEANPDDITEEAVDACENAADVLEAILVKNR